MNLVEAERKPPEAEDNQWFGFVVKIPLGKACFFFGGFRGLAVPKNQNSESPLKSNGLKRLAFPFLGSPAYFQGCFGSFQGCFMECKLPFPSFSTMKSPIASY